MQEIARLGGGTVVPRGHHGALGVSSFLHNGTVSLFEKQGFKRTRRLGKNHWIVASIVAAQPK